MRAKRVVTGMIRDARYYEQYKSIAIVMEEVGSKAILKPMQIPVAALKSQLNLMAEVDDPAAWRFFARQLMKRTHPLRLEFDEKLKQDGDEV